MLNQINWRKTTLMYGVVPLEGDTQVLRAWSMLANLQPSLVGVACKSAFAPQRTEY